MRPAGGHARRQDAVRAVVREGHLECRRCGDGKGLDDIETKSGAHNTICGLDGKRRPISPG